MDDLFASVPIWLLATLALCLVGLAASIGVALFTFVFKVGVAINESRKPPHLDAGDYRLEQGHEVRTETTQRRDRQDPGS